METNPSPIENKTIGIVAYLTVIGLLIAFVMNQEKKDAFGTYHIRQALGITVSGIALSFIAIIPILGWIVAILGSLLLFVMWIMGLINAINGNMKPVPVFGEKFIEWFQGVG